MIKQHMLVTVLSGGATPYYQRVMATTPIAYWALDDTSGAVAVDKMALGNGALGAGGAAPTMGVTGIGDGLTGYSFDGGDYVNVYSAALNTAFDPLECSLMIWIKIATAQWDALSNYWIMRIGADAANNLCEVYKKNAANQLELGQAAGGTYKRVLFTTDGRETWVQIALTVSKSNDRLKVFFAGAQVGTTQTGLGVWAGALSNIRCALGSASGSAASSAFIGSLAHAAVWSRELTPAEVAALSSPFDSNSTLRYILSVGDSKTAGSGDSVGLPPGYQSPLCLLLHDALGWHVAENRIGIGGIETDGMAARVDADIAAMTVTPNEILINLGANDCNADPGKAAWKADMDYIINAYHTAFPSANIRLAKIWRRATVPNYATVIAYMNEAQDELYASYAWLQTGINEALFLEGGDDGATYTGDGVHPTTAGYALEAAAWKTAITG